MPPKRKFAKADIIRAAYDIVRENGLTELSARRIADRINSSVAPIYSHFDSVEDLRRTALKLARETLFRYVSATETDSTSRRLMLGLLRFAGDERNLFEALFIHRASKDFASEFKTIIRLELNKERDVTNLPDSERDLLMETIWMTAFGAASLLSIGHHDETTEDRLIASLEKIESAFTGS
jgi:AcrR family transcriptional regulator